MGKGQETTLRWVFHPMRSRPLAGGLALAATLGATYGAVLYIGSLAFSLPIALIFLYSLRQLFLPSTYELTREHVRLISPIGSRRASWEKFKGYRLARNGVMLCRLKQASTMDRISGFFLYVDDEQVRTQVLAYVKGRCE